MGKPRMILKATPFLRKQTGQIYKLFNLWEKEKNPSVWGRKLFDQPTSPPQPKEGKPVFLTKTQGLNTKYITRRQIVLNRHFTEIISDVLVNNLKKPLDELGVTITSIESKAWNKGVSVFYYTDKPFDEKTHEELNSLVGRLRFSINERQLTGRTPQINFVYDQVAQIERALEASLRLADIKPKAPETELVEEPQSKKVVFKQQYAGGQSKFNMKEFSAPPDMVNMALGLDYATMYNKVASKLDRGRGQSERIPSSASLASLGPMLKLPSEESTEEDPVQRIKAMQKFMVLQRKKKEYLAKVRRKQELLHRDSIKWDVPEEDEDEHEQPVEKRYVD